MILSKYHFITQVFCDYFKWRTLRKIKVNSMSPTKPGKCSPELQVEELECCYNATVTVFFITERKRWTVVHTWERYNHQYCELRSLVNSNIKTAKQYCPSHSSSGPTPEAGNDLDQHHCWEEQEHVVMFLTGVAYSPAWLKKSGGSVKGERIGCFTDVPWEVFCFCAWKSINHLCLWHLRNAHTERTPYR